MRKSINVLTAFLTALLACSCSQPAPSVPAEPGAGNFTLSGIAERKDAMQAGTSLDAAQNVMMSFNTTGIGRGYVGADGKPTILFAADDRK